MTIQRIVAAASSLAIVMALSACGGGGASSGVVSAPLPPPPGPPPAPPPASPPAPPTSQIVTTAPAAATAPATPALPQAIAGSPTIAAPGTTLLPLLQTVQVAKGATIGPDSVTMTAGATLVLNPSARQATFHIANPALDSPNVGLISEPQTVYFETSGNTVIRLWYSALDWTAFGDWTVFPGGVNPVSSEHFAEFITGFQTPGSAVPTTGSASYIGVASGGRGYISGDANLQANFAARTITGSLTNMTNGSWDDGYLPWNSVSLSASFAAGQSGFTGTSAVSSAPDNDRALKAGATGTLVGSFFGPLANELGAVWTLFDGTTAATGTIGARKAP